MVTQLALVSSHSSPNGSSLFDRQGDLRTRTWRPYGWSGREYVYLEHFSAFHSSTAVLHLGQDHDANLRYVKNHFWNSVGLLLHETGKLIGTQTEITGVSTLQFKNLTWMSTSLFCSKAYRITNAKSLRLLRLCAGKMGEHPIWTWKSKIEWYSESNHFKDVNRIDGMPTEFEWKLVPGFTRLGLLEKIQSVLRDMQCEPEHFKDRTIFMSMYNGIVWESKRKYRKMWIQFTDSCELCS